MITNPFLPRSEYPHNDTPFSALGFPAPPGLGFASEFLRTARRIGSRVDISADEDSDSEEDTHSERDSEDEESNDEEGSDSEGPSYETEYSDNEEDARPDDEEYVVYEDEGYEDYGWYDEEGEYDVDEEHQDSRESREPAEVPRRTEMNMSAMERAAGGDFDAAIAEYEAQERRFARERAQWAEQRRLAERHTHRYDRGVVNDPTFIIDPDADVDEIIRQAGGGQDDGHQQPTAGNARSNRARSIPDSASGVYDPIQPFNVGGVPFQWDFSCIHRTTGSDPNPTVDTLCRNTAGPFNPRHYPSFPDVESDNTNISSSAPARMDHRLAEPRYNHPGAFSSAPNSQGTPAAANRLPNSGRINQGGLSLLHQESGFDDLDLLFAGEGPFNPGASSQVSAGRNLRLTENQLNDPNTASLVPSPLQVIPRKRPLTAEETERRVRLTRK